MLDALLPANMERSASVGATEKISEELVNSGKYTVLDRTTVGQSLKEIEFQMSGLVSDAEIRKAGEQLSTRLGASFVVVAQVSKIGGTYFISAKPIDVKTGEIVAQASHDAEGEIAVSLRIAQVVGQKLVSGTRESAQIAQDSSPSAPQGNTAGSSRPTQPWARFVGTWLVDIAKRPAGWNDYKYDLSNDGTLEIFHYVDSSVVLEYRGTVASVVENSMTTKAELPSGKPDMVIYYAFVTDARLKIGWGEDFGPGLTLELARQ